MYTLSPTHPSPSHTHWPIHSALSKEGGSFTASTCGPHLSNLDEWLRSYIIPLMSDYFYLRGSGCERAAGARNRPICGSAGLSFSLVWRLNFSALTTKADGGSVFYQRKHEQTADPQLGSACHHFIFEQFLEVQTIYVTSWMLTLPKGNQNLSNMKLSCHRKITVCISAKML